MPEPTADERAPTALLSREILKAIAAVDAECRRVAAPLYRPRVVPEPPLSSIDSILKATPEQGTDLPAAMRGAMDIGEKHYLLSHERRLLAITLARALPEIARLRSTVATLTAERDQARKWGEAAEHARAVEHAAVSTLTQERDAAIENMALFAGMCCRLNDAVRELGLPEHEQPDVPILDALATARTREADLREAITDRTFALHDAEKMEELAGKAMRGEIDNMTRDRLAQTLMGCAQRLRNLARAALSSPSTPQEASS